MHFQLNTSKTTTQVKKWSVPEHSQPRRGPSGALSRHFALLTKGTRTHFLALWIYFKGFTLSSAPHSVFCPGHSSVFFHYMFLLSPDIGL